MSDSRDKSLISVRVALVFLVAAVIAIGAGVLTLMSGSNLAASVLAGGAAFGAALALSNQLISTD